MENDLNDFEEVVAKCVQAGVFPSFHRRHNGWTCELWNTEKQKLFPIDASEQKTGGTLLEAFNFAVEEYTKIVKDVNKFLNSEGNRQNLG